MAKSKLRQPRKKKTEDTVRAIVTDRGHVVTMDILKRYELSSEPPVSKQKDPAQLWGSQIVQPPKDLERLLYWMDIDTTHASCIHVKKGDVVGLGYEIIQDEEVANEVEGEIIENENYKKLKTFFGHVNDEEDITSVLKKVYVDYDGCGNGYIEVSKDLEGLVNGMFWSSAIYIRWHKDKQRLVQIVGNTKTWFKKFGFVHHEGKELNKNTGEWETDIAPENLANEMIHIKQHSWKSSYYGMPEWLPAIYAIFGNLKEREYNIDFFINYGIPAYAIVVSGGNLDDEVEDEITKFFKTELKGSNHKTLTLSTPRTTEVKFEKLSVDTKESSFRMYHQDNRDEILSAHRVPPYRVGIVIQGQLGGNVAEETDKIYLDSVINPSQEQFAWIMNDLVIKQGMQMTGWLYRFLDIDVADAVKRADIHGKYFAMASITPNEIRADLGLEPYIGGDAFYIQGSLTPVGISKEGIDSGRLDEQKEQEALEAEERTETESSTNETEEEESTAAEERE